jgi:hypothetical protein
MCALAQEKAGMSAELTTVRRQMDEVHTAQRRGTLLAAVARQPGASPTHRDGLDRCARVANLRAGSALPTPPPRPPPRPPPLTPLSPCPQRPWLGGMTLTHLPTPPHASRETWGLTGALLRGLTLSFPTLPVPAPAPPCTALPCPTLRCLAWLWQGASCSVRGVPPPGPAVRTAAAGAGHH